MAILTVGPASTYASIAAAMLVASSDDTILLQSGYSNETAIVTQTGLTVTGGADSTGIVLQLQAGDTNFTAGGLAPLTILDAPDGNTILGNGGNDIIRVSGGVDAVTGGAGTSDRLVVDYSLATGAVTGDSTSNFTEAGGGGRSVTITNGTIENFTVLTGAGSDTLTVGDGNNFVNAGNGANTVTAGQGANTIIGGTGPDTFTAGDGGNILDGGDGTNTLTSGNGNDIVLSGTGADTIVTNGGSDTITVTGGADSVDAGTGNDRLIVDYSATASNVTGGITGGNLSTGYVGHIADVTGDSVDFQAVENLTITTGTGNDAIVTGAGGDVISTGAGNDLVTGGGGNDTIDGGPGNDTAVYSGDLSAYVVTYNAATQTFTVADGRAASPDGTDTVTAVETFRFNGVDVSAAALIAAAAGGGGGAGGGGTGTGGGSTGTGGGTGTGGTGTGGGTPSDGTGSGSSGTTSSGFVTPDGTAVAANPGSVSPVVISFAPTATFSSPISATLTGTAAAITGAVAVEMFEGTTDLGAASVDASGAWSFTGAFAPGFHKGISAVSTDAAGNSASVGSQFDLTTGIRHQAYTAVQDRYSDGGSTFDGQTYFKQHGAVLYSSAYAALPNGDQSYTYSDGTFFKGKALSSFTDTYTADGDLTQHSETNRDGSHTIQADADGQSLHSIGADFFGSNKSNESFVFSHGFGHDTIDGFTVSGPGHDTIVLPPTAMTHLADILNSAHMAGGDTTLNIGHHDTITLQGVSVAELKAHPNDFKFHG